MSVITKLNMTSDTLTPSELEDQKLAAQVFAGLLGQIIEFTDLTGPGIEEIHISNAGSHVGAAGYHIWRNQTPIGYISPRNSGNRLWGHYIAPLDVHAVTINGVTTPAHRVHEALYTPGICTVIAHELAEMWADRDIATFTHPDSKGRQWLLEPCDWVYGTYFIRSIGHNVAIFPNVAFNFDLTFKTNKWDLLGILKGPFTRTPKGYAYGRINGGQLFPITD